MTFSFIISVLSLAFPESGFILSCMVEELRVTLNSMTWVSARLGV